jgi:hypothetical protein
MRRSHVACLLGLALAALISLALGTTTTLRARQGRDLQDDFVPAGPPNLYHVEAPPRTVAETRTWLKLQTIVPMNFPDGTTLEDLVKFVRESTRDVNNGFPRGIPIYVDPQGLQDADKTMASTVTIDLDGMPVGKALRLAVRPLGLVTEIDKDGLLSITSSRCGDGEPIPNDAANWQSLDMLSEEIRALRAEVSALRRGLKPDGAASAPATGSPTASGPVGGSGGGFR